MTGLRARFAKNLRRLSSGAESYAAVARAVGINRQQFNDYLTGNNLPNETIIKKLCKHFNVDLSEFFTRTDEIQDREEEIPIDEKTKRFILKFVKVHSQNQKQLPKSGLYHVYFEVPGNPNLIICSLLAVKNQGGMCEFRRITKIEDEYFGKVPKNVAVHAGFVTYSKLNTIFFGYNTTENCVPTVMICESIVSKNVLYAGTAFVNAPSQYSFVNFVVPKPKEKLSLREALRAVKLHDIASREICQPAVRLLKRQRDGMSELSLQRLIV